MICCANHKLPRLQDPEFYHPFQLTWNIAGKRRKSKPCYTRCVGPINKHLLLIFLAVYLLFIIHLLYNVPSELKRVDVDRCTAVKCGLAWPVGVCSVQLSVVHAAGRVSARYMRSY